MARSGGPRFVKQTVTSLTVGVTAPFVVERYALYSRYRVPLNWLRDAPLVVKNVAAVPSGPTKLNGPAAALLPATWNWSAVPAGVVAFQDNVCQAGANPGAGLLSMSAET